MFPPPLFLKERLLFLQGEGAVVQCGDKVFIGGFFEVLGDKPFAGNQLIDADAEFSGEQRQHLHIWQVATGLPTGNGFIGHAEALAQRLLGQAFFMAQLRQK